MFYQPRIDFTPEEVLLYSRKSQTDDPNLTVEEVLANHEKMLDEWAEKFLGGKIPEENKFREVVSGETIDARPEFQKVLRLIESPKYKATLTVDVARLSRGDLEDAGRLIKLYRYSNTTVLTIERCFDLRDSYERENFERKLKEGNQYLEYVKQKLKDGRNVSASVGNYIGSTPPYGYNKITIIDGKKKCPTLEENPEQADIVRLIFDMYGNRNMGRTAIAYKLDEMGVKPPKGKQWSPTAIKEMLKNVHYIGKVRWNWRQIVKVVEDGQVKKKRPQSNMKEYLIFEGKHKGIVSEEMFYKVQERIGKNHRAVVGVKVRNPFVSLMFCKKCGKAMILKEFKDKNGNASCAPRIMCSDQARCGTGSCLFEELVDRVCVVLRECIADFEVRLQNDTSDSEKLHASLVKSLEKQLADLQTKELNQWELQSHPDPKKRMPQEIFNQLNEKLLKEKEDVQNALCKAKESIPEKVDYKEKIVTFKTALDALNDPTVDAEQKNIFLKSCIERIDYFREKPFRTTGKWSSPPIELDITLR